MSDGEDVTDMRVDMIGNHFGRHQIQKNVCVSHFVWPKPTAAFGLE